MWNAEWLRLNDTLCVIARNEAIQTISIQINGNEQKADCESGRPFFVAFSNTISVFTLAIGTCGVVFFRYNNLVLGKNV